ncbi:MAG TPA: sodium:solute symporter family protein [Candidatus Alectryocaccobium stercorigallinarum]|nr:sodium:solute symporter family protein [Candidatus Alectryocaccobium stercorigallinarum]
MQIGIIIVVILYEVISIAFSGWKTAKDNKSGKSDFALGGRSLGTWAIGTTLCLTLLGSGHLTGTWEGALTIGGAQIWHVMANGFAMALGAYTTYKWARRMRVTTTGGLLKTLYGDKIALMVAAVNIAVGWAVTSFETQALGIIINSLTGIDLPICVIIATALGFFYVAIGGTKQVAMLNQINVIILYVGMFGALIILLTQLPGMNFDTVRDYYVSNPSYGADFVSFTGGTEHFIQVAIPVCVAPFFAHMTGQQTIQTAASAKNEKSLKRIAWFVGPMNVIIGAISICLTLTARSMPQFDGISNKLVCTEMLLDMMPPWFMAILIAAFIAAILSSYGGFLMGAATSIVYDFVKLYKPKMNAKQETKWMRIALLIGGIYCGIMAQTLPTIVLMFTWIYSFMIPVLWYYLFGFWWKRDERVALTAFIASFAVASFASFASPILPAWYNNIHISYQVMVVSLLIMIIGTAMSKNAKPGYFKSREWFESEAYRDYLEEVKSGNA